MRIAFGNCLAQQLLLFQSETNSASGRHGRREDGVEHMLKKKKMSLLVFGSVLLLAEITFAQPAATGTLSNENWTFAVEAVASEPQSSQRVDTALSRGFVAYALNATAQIRNWQSHLAFTLQNGYPLSDSWIASDRDQAADAVRLAAVAITSDNDRTALQLLLTLFVNVQNWSDARINDEKQLQLATYYVSRSTLDNDESFQKNMDCTNSLAAMLASGRLEGVSCR